MRDPKRIGRILKLLEFIWESTPDLRLGQLLYVFADFRGDIFDYEDDNTEEKLKQSIREYLNA